jgi:cell cycle arrest protein BUB3
MYASARTTMKLSLVGWTGTYEGRHTTVILIANTDTVTFRLDLTTGEQTVVSQHDAAVNKIAYDPTSQLLVSSSWDKTLHLHVLSSNDRSIPTTLATIALDEKPYSISLSPSKLIVAMSTRKNYIYELEYLRTLASENNSISNKIHAEPWQVRESSMKFMTRAVACNSNDTGYASSSIEGRVAVDWFDPSAESQSRKYAFKCHRAPIDGIDTVYPVNALAFHPGHGTFASGGGDGIVAIWDGVAKRRIKQYKEYSASVAALAFSANGKYLAVGVCPGFEDGKEPEEMDGQVKVWIRELGPDEAKAKPRK